MRRRLAVLAVNLVALAVLAELAALAIYYVRNGALFYAQRASYDLIPETAQGELTADRLHPYFGPTHKPGHPFNVSKELGRPAPPRSTNNFGFVSPLDYPFARTNPYQFIVGIFGGSVGVWFCQLGAERLIEDLKQHELFRKRDVIVLCFSHEGYKQPQQLQVLSYFLSIGQTFDLVVNIDGFNEVALSRLNDAQGLDISMPSAVHLQPLMNLINQSTLTSEKLASLAAIARRKRELNDLALRINTTRLASIYVVLEQRYKSTLREHQAELARFAALPNASNDSLVYANPPVRERRGEALYEDVARTWAGSSMLMSDMLAPRGVWYVHVLQPNQYQSGRRLSDAEAATAIDPGSVFKEGVERGYPALARASADLIRSDRLMFIDGRGIFDREPSPVYIDSCCHYTLAGNRILADAIARRVLEASRVRTR